MLRTCLPFAVAVVLCTSMVYGARVKQQETTLLGHKAGDVIDGFHLHEHLGNVALKDNPALAVKASLLEQRHHTSSHATAGRPLVAFPSELPSNVFSGAPRHLGAGSFGESWLVTGGPGTEYEGQKVVAKFLYIEVSKGRYSHVTKDHISTNPVLRKEVKEAARECNFAKRLQKAAANMTQSSAKRAQRLMACYGHNFMKVTPKRTPIYLILENCGAKDLDKFISEHRDDMDAELMGSITRQIVEGLQYLAEMQPLPVIHHDMKPANIVVKEQQGSRFPLVYLIDFGAMMEADPRKAKAGTVATSVFAPPEWFKGFAFKSPAASFDMYAVGNILADMALGNTFGGFYWNERKDSPDFNLIGQISEIRSRSEFVNVFRKLDAPGLLSMENSVPAYNFIVDFWTRMVSNDANLRGSPADVLGSEWLSGSPSPDDPDWVMYTPPVSSVSASDKVEDESQEEDGVEESNGCLHSCDLCLNVAGTMNRRKKVVCAVEIENLKDPDWIKVGINTKFCSRINNRMAVGRNKHGKDGHQEYYTWFCGELTASEVKAEAKH